MKIQSGQNRTLIVLAFAAIYLVWGSTYLAIRVVVETLPAFSSAAARFIIAGGVLFLFLRSRGVEKPDARQWRQAAITGSLLLVGGNGLVVWAERNISSGLAALLVGLTPMWFALLDWIRPHGVRPARKTFAGIAIGFVGVFLLATGRESSGLESAHGWATVAVIIAGISWATGSLYSKYSSHPASPWMNAATQMVCGGVGLMLVGLSIGEPFQTNWSQISGRSLIALVYLIVFGSWIGFSAYIWLLKVSTPSRVSTYAYVNPAIAVFLGWAFLGERVNAHMLWGAAVILIGVVIITLPSNTVRGSWNRLRRTSKGQGKASAVSDTQDCPAIK